MNSVIFNYQAANAARQYNIVSSNNRKTTEKLSSGYKINRAADDAAGLSISEKMRYQVRGLNRASDNILDGVSLVQTAEGAMNEVDAILQRMRELSVQAANDTNTKLDRDAIQAEIDESIKEIDHIAETTSFNGIYPLRADYRFLDGQDAIVNETQVQTPTTKGNGDYHMDSTVKVVENGKPLETKGVNVDFAKVNPRELDGKTFFATCSANCSQVFTFAFDDSTDASSAELFNVDSIAVVIGTKSMVNGADIPAKIGEQLRGIPIYTSINAKADDTYQIGHANKLYVHGSEMTFYPTSGTAGSSHSSSTLRDKDGNVLTTGFNMGTVYMHELKDIVEVKTQKEVILPENPKYALHIQSGALAWQDIKVPLVWMEARKMGVDPLSVGSFNEAGQSINAIDEALTWANAVRSTFGACQNRLEDAMKVDDSSAENTDAAESRIRDTDIASEMVKYSMENILKQAGESMISQANQNASQILSLLQ